MTPEQWLAILATAITTTTPLVFACLGETLTERAGVINLSAEGTLLMGAMTGFAVAYHTQNLWLGFAAAAGIGILFALIVAWGSLTLKQSQVAIGFVLALLGGDLSSFLGNAYVLTPGPTVPSWPLPGLSGIPVLGPIFFRGDVLVYLSYLLTLGLWVLFYRTGVGLWIRMIGEQPAAAFARGIPVQRWRYGLTLIGGALMGIGGAAFSLDFKAGWTHRHTAGYGWIALAIVIFGSWDPLRVVVGAYLFGILQSLASVAQSQVRGIPTQVLSVAPFVLMIAVLALSSEKSLGWLLRPLPIVWQQRLRGRLGIKPPAGLGQPFEGF
ncbi:MAG: ABC transporter permease [Thermostichales cyanobacterium SRBZ-1_bins_19]